MHGDVDMASVSATSDQLGWLSLSREEYSTSIWWCQITNCELLFFLRSYESSGVDNQSKTSYNRSSVIPMKETS